MHEQLKPVAWAHFTEEGLVRIWSTKWAQLKTLTDSLGKEPTALYAIPADQVLVPRELLEDIEMTWRIPDKSSKSLNELGEQKIRDGLNKLRALIQR